MQNIIQVIYYKIKNEPIMAQRHVPHSCSTCVFLVENRQPYAQFPTALAAR